MWDSDWARWAADKILSVVGVLALIVSGAAIRFWRSDRSMLLRHDRGLDECEKEMGVQRAFREQVGRGPMGEVLVKHLDELKEVDRLLHRRVSRTNKKQVATDKQVAEIANDIKWIRRHLENGHRDT